MHENRNSTLRRLLAAASVSVAVALVGAVGARSALISSASQKVRCERLHTEYACKTPMRLVCHKSPGQTVLSRIPDSAAQLNAEGARVWNIDFVPFHRWGGDGYPPVVHGRLAIKTPRGVRREEAIVTLPTDSPPATEVIIWARCS